jgi:2-methylcitrate dehydratase PrpD
VTGPTAALADWASTLEAGALSTCTRHAARRAYLDWAACTIAGAKTKLAQTARRALGPSPAQGPATVLAADCRTEAAQAAFYNAFACHVLEYDDLHGPSIYHPGAPTISAAVAVAEREGCTTAELAAAIVAGYEIGIRVGQAAGTGHYRRHHTTGTVGTLGAAAAVARLLHLAPGAFAEALGLAATQAAALWAFQDERADSKPLHAAHAALAGIMAADLARAGLRGGQSAIESPRGFLATLGGEAASSVIVTGLGTDPPRIEDLTLKAYPCCGHTHPGLEAATALAGDLRAAGASPADVSEVTIATYESAIALTRIFAPRTPTEAAFSYPYVVARCLARGELGSAFTVEALADAETADIMARTQLHHDPLCDADYPERQPVTVTVRLTDGRIFEQHRSHARGSPHLPLDDDAHRRKVCALLGSRVEDWLVHAADLLTTVPFSLPGAAASTMEQG